MSCDTKNVSITKPETSLSLLVKEGEFLKPRITKSKIWQNSEGLKMSMVILKMARQNSGSLVGSLSRADK